METGVSQRIPSPRELQFHTQTIMQNALIKKKLEEQRENFRKRQELQQQQQQPQGPNSQQRNANFLQQLQSNSSTNQIPITNNNQNVPANMEHQFWPPKEMNDGFERALQDRVMQLQIDRHQEQSQQQKHANQHTSSPTPTLAFTPTSVLRKMTAEKETDNSANNNSNPNQKVSQPIQFIR